MLRAEVAELRAAGVRIGATERLTLDFGRRFAAGESCRSIKSDPAFIEQREYVLGRVFAEREEFA